MTKSKDKTKKSDWEKFLSSLPLYADAPDGFLDVVSYAERAGTTRPTILKAIRSGKIPKKHCVSVRFSTNQRRKVLINWNATAYNYIVSRQEHTWPSDFERNDEHIYRPIEVSPGAGADGNGEDGPPVAGQLLTDEMDYQPVVDLTSAKLRTEQLKILEAQTKIRVANNELVLIEEAAAIMGEIAMEVKGLLLRYINDVAPKVGPKKINVVDCRKILRENFVSVLTALEPVESGAPELKATFQNRK